MKKLVLVMVFILLMALFIAFNYLLWDRESKINEIKTLQYNNVNNSTAIGAQNRDIKRLEEENSNLQSEIDKLEKEKEQVLQKTSELNKKIEDATLLEQSKNTLIDALKQNVDIKVFELPIRKWAEAIDSGMYDEAYKIEFAGSSQSDGQTNRQEYTESLKNNIKSIKLKSAEINKEVENDQGEIVISVVLDVKLVEGSDSSIARFKEGANEVSFKIAFNSVLNEFYISEISQ